MILLLPSQALVLNAYAVLVYQTPGNPTLREHQAYIAANGDAAYKTALNGIFANQTTPQLATALLANLGLGGVFTQADAEAYLTANANNRVGAMIDLADALFNYNGPDAGLLAAKNDYVNTITGSYNYSINSGHTNPTAITQGYTLTSSIDVATSSYFNAPQAYTPDGNKLVNSLQNDDKLTGTASATDTLDATLGNPNDNGQALIMPTLNGIEILNLKFDSTSNNMVLDLQDSTGVTTINVSRIAEGFAATVQNIADATATNLSVNNSFSPNNGVSFTYIASAVSGVDTADLTLNNVNTAWVRLEERGAAPTEGFETINLVSTGSANTVRQFIAEDLQTLNISGDRNLTLANTATVLGAQGIEATAYAASLANVAGSLTAIDASAFTGNLSITLGNELNAGLDGTSGLPVQMTVTGGAGDDIFRLAQGVNIDAVAANTDRINGGAGANSMVLFGGAAQVIAAAAAPNLTNIQSLEIRAGHDLGLGGVEVADVITVNARAFDALGSIYIRNEGQTVALGATQRTSAAEGMTVNLNNLNATQAGAITVAHGTTGNSTIANNIVNLTFATAATNNAAQVTLVDGINNDPVFNLNLNAASAELVTIVDNDTESNTVHLADAARTQAGSTLTVLPGADSDAGRYMNFDSFNAAAVAAGGTLGYGYATNGTAGSSTTALAAASRDNAVSTVFYGTVGAAADGVTRHTFENLAAGDYAGDIIIRLGEVTRADGVSSMRMTTGTGNDSFIFDQIASTNAGFTSGDTIAAGAGTDSLIIDGNTATIPGTPRIDLQTSEWDNLTGIDVLRFANNAGVGNGGGVVASGAGAYYARIDNDFVNQTDAKNRLTVISNDGDLTTNTESDLELDLRGLSQDKWVTFVGANANGAASAGVMASNRIVVDDISANQNMILNGGDTDVRVNTTAGYVAGNNNVYEVRNTAHVSINDLAQTSNFGQINFTNDQAVAQTLGLTLNNTVVEALVDASSASSTTAPEILDIVATDNIVAGTASALNVDARQVTGFLGLNVTGSAVGNDVITLNSNVGGAASTLNLGGGAADRINWTGAATTVVINHSGGAIFGFATDTHSFQTGAVATTHNVTLDTVEIFDITGMTYTNSTIDLSNGSQSASTVLGGAGADAITGSGFADRLVGGVGVDNLTGGAGADVFVYAAGDSGITVATADTITDFVSGTDKLDFVLAGTAANFTDGGAGGTTLAAAVTAANLVFAGAVGVQRYYFEDDTIDGFFVADVNGDGVADLAIQMTGLTTMVFGDII